MKKIDSFRFVQLIAADFKIDIRKKCITFKHQFPIRNGVRKIKSSNDAIVVNHKGEEFPYMIGQKRNEEQLVDFDYIYVNRFKSLEEVLKEAKITLKSESVRISEGGGWYSTGRRYYYKDYMCEI